MWRLRASCSARRGTVGSCVCFLRIAKIAVTLINELGENGWLESQGIQLRKHMGPRAPRFLAARRSENNDRTLPPNSDWEAKAL